MNTVRSSIRNKLIVLLLLAAVVPFGVSIIINYQLTSRSVQDQTLQENIKLLSEGKRNIDSYLKRIDQLGLTLYNSASTNNLFRRDVQEDNTFYAKIKDMLLTILRTSPNIRRIDLYVVSSGKTYTLTPTLWRQSGYQETGTSPFGPVLQNPYRGYFIPQDNLDEFLYRRAFVDIPGRGMLGSLTIAIDSKELEELVHDLYVPDESEFYLFNPEGQALYNSEQGDGLHRDVAASAVWFYKIRQDQRESGYWEWEDAGFRGITIFNKLTGSHEGWVLVKRIPYDVLNRNAREIVRINLQIGAWALILAVAATLIVSFKITHPLQILVRNIRNIKKGNLQVDFDCLGHDEIGVVGDQFKSMVETIRSLMIKEYNLEIQNKTQQLNTLQAQLNPHFLNNALQSTAALAYEKEDFEVYRLIRSLSKMMRYSMNFEEELVPLAKEIDHVRAYLELQQHRFEERLRVELDVDGQCDDWLIPKMTLQPLVENYFKHAFDLQSGDGYLLIRTVRVDSGGERKLAMTVEDNGRGMAEAEMEALVHAIDRPPEQGEPYGKVGLVNLFRRIRLYYGETAEIKLENRENGGFRVSLLLPRHILERDGSIIFSVRGDEA